MPAPIVRCPYHIGVVLSTRYNAFRHDRSQEYDDSLEPEENAKRAKDHIHWVVTKGDLVNQPKDNREATGIRKEVPIIRRITRDGSKAGYISVILSSESNERELPKMLNGPQQSEYRTISCE